MELSRSDLIKKGDLHRILYDSLSILFVALGLLAAFTWSLGPDVGPWYLNTPLVQGSVILLLALLLMISTSDQ